MNNVIANTKFASTRAGSTPTPTLNLAGVDQYFIDEIAVHQPGQHTQSDPVG